MDERKGGGLTTLATWVGLVTALVTSGYSFGIQTNRIGNLEKQVDDMRTDTRSNAETLAEIKDTTTVIKTKLEILLPTSAVQKLGAR